MRQMWPPSAGFAPRDSAQELLLGLGSNCQPEYHLQQALQWLQQRFGHIERSVVYESAAVGFNGDPFHNLVVAIQYEGLLSALRDELKALEDRFGRERQRPKFSPRNLDLDILTWGGRAGWYEGLVLPRPDCFHYSYVLRPLAELRPHQLVPGRTLTWEQLWEQSAHEAHPLTLVEARYAAADALIEVL